MGDAKISTVEHVLAALVGMGLKNVSDSFNKFLGIAKKASFILFSMAKFLAGVRFFGSLNFRDSDIADNNLSASFKKGSATYESDRKDALS